MKDPGPAYQPLIEIHDLDVEYYQQGAWVPVVENLHLHVNRAETFGLVGESGCGKSTTANVMLGFRPRGARYRSGSCWFEGRDLLALPNAALEEVRGNKIALVPQNPTTALSPGMCVGDQIAETLLTHKRSASRQHAHDRAVELLGLVSLTEPEKAYTRYPHQLSGGQQQRAVIAMALACVPQLVILDEPTTGLDVTTQAQILDLLVDLRGKYGLAMFYVTHNLGVVAQICHRIGVMYAGRLVEVSPNRTLFHNPVHPYTQGLISSVPRIGNPSRHQSVLLKGLLHRSELPPGCNFAPRCEFATPDCFTQAPDLEMVDADHAVACWRWREIPPLRIRQTDCGPDVDIALDRERFASKPPLLEIEGLTAGYAVRRSALSLRRTRKVIAEDISLDIRPGETFALVGESGSGKTTVARAVVGLLPFVSGTVIFRDCNDRRNDLTVALVKRGDDVVRCVQLVFQNPDASLNPRQRIGQIIGRPLEVLAHMSGQALRDRVNSLMADVRLDSKYYGCYPDELSGGERQRVAIARCPGRRTTTPAVRRDPVRAGRLGPGQHHRAAGRSADPPWHRLPVHLARPGRRPLAGAPGRRAVLGRDVRGGERGRGFLPAVPSLHLPAAECRSRGRSGPGHPARPPRRGPRDRREADRLSVCRLVVRSRWEMCARRSSHRGCRSARPTAFAAMRRWRSFSSATCGPTASTGPD